MAILKYLCGIFVFVSIWACADEKIVIPSGFEIIANNGPYSFVYMDKKFAGDKMAQRNAGEMICKKAGATDYCEVYFWIDRNYVQTKMPIKRNKVKRGIYYIKEGKANLKALL